MTHRTPGQSPYQYPSNLIPVWLGRALIEVLIAAEMILDALEWVWELPERVFDWLWAWLWQEELSPEWMEREEGRW